MCLPKMTNDFILCPLANAEAHDAVLQVNFLGNWTDLIYVSQVTSSPQIGCGLRATAEGRRWHLLSLAVYDRDK